MAIKNQSIVVTYFAWDTGNQVGKTGDAGNHTIYVSIDGVANAVDDTSSAEVDATNLQGHYQVTLTAAEMNGNHIMVGGESSTSNIIIVPISITTERGDLDTVDGNVDSILLQTGTNGVKIGAGALTATAIGADAITSAKIADGAIGADQIAANAIGASELATDAITSDEFAASAVTEIVTGVLTTAMTEAYSADGAAPTLAQALFAIQQFLQERIVSGTTLTVNKVDGSTGAMTFTLSSATEPVSITRAS